MGFLKLPALALCQIFKSAFNLKSFIQLDHALVRDSSPSQLTFLFLRFNVSSDVPQSCCWFLRFSGSILPNWTVSGLEILVQVIVFSCRSTCRV